MLSGSRMSRRIMVAVSVAGVFFVIGLMVVKDLNDKMVVMTASNHGYQKMTDNQSDRIRKLEREVKDSRQRHKLDVEEFTRKESDCKAKLSKLQQQLATGSKTLETELAKTKKELESLHQTHEREMDELEEGYTRLQRANSEMKLAKDAREKELRDQMMGISRQLEMCNARYSALVDKQQPDEENEGNAQETLSRQEKRVAAMPLKPGKLRKPIRGHKSAVLPPPPKILSKYSSASTPAGTKNKQALEGRLLEEPYVFGKEAPSVKQVNEAYPPVAAEPPLAKDKLHGEEAPVVHQNGRYAEDDGVVEAPMRLQGNPAVQPLRQPRRKLVEGRLKAGPNLGENLDQMVDHVQQDHPELPGPLDTGRLDRGFQQQEEENEADDAVDGRVIGSNNGPKRFDFGREIENEVDGFEGEDYGHDSVNLDRAIAGRQPPFKGLNGQYHQPKALPPPPRPVLRRQPQNDPRLAAGELPNRRRYGGL